MDKEAFIVFCYIGVVIFVIWATFTHGFFGFVGSMVVSYIINKILNYIDLCC